MKWIFVVLLVALMACPAIAGVSNISVNDSSFVSHTYKSDQSYMRFEYLVLTIALGVACLAISRIWESTEDIFSVAAVIPMAVGAWFSNYCTFEHVEVIGSQVVFAQVVTPNPYLSAIMFVLTICAILNLIWIYLAKPADEKTGGEHE